jgi:hypothetical protein
MKHSILALSLALVAAIPAYAANQAVLAWTAPTTYEDGTPIGAGLTFNVYQGLQGAAKVKGPNVSATTVTINTGLLSGKTYCWNVTSALNSLESVPSNEACKTFPQSAPSAPASLTAQ